MEDILKTPLKTAIIAGNHKILPSGEIIFDVPALERARKLQKNIPQVCLICLLDTKTSPVSFMSSISKEMLIKNESLLPHVSGQILGIDHVIFESNVKNWANRKSHKTKMCPILGPNAYREHGETKICSCWGLLAITILRLFDEYQFEKVILVSSPDSVQLKVSDVLKTKVFLETDPRFELIWAK